jgi:hypothetical protein
MPQIMFEIYRESACEGSYRVVYFTELEEHDKELEIRRAMAGEHFYDGFIATERRVTAKEAITRLVDRLNKGEPITTQDVERQLSEFKPVAAE